MNCAANIGLALFKASPTSCSTRKPHAARLKGKSLRCRKRGLPALDVRSFRSILCLQRNRTPWRLPAVCLQLLPVTQIRPERQGRLTGYSLNDERTRRPVPAFPLRFNRNGTYAIVRGGRYKRPMRGPLGIVAPTKFGLYHNALKNASRFFQVLPRYCRLRKSDSGAHYKLLPEIIHLGCQRLIPGIIDNHMASVRYFDI